MKNIFLYLSIVTLSLSCFSCDDDEELEVVTIGDASNIYISSEAGRREVPLTATCAWTVERDSLTRQWVNIERKSGEGDGSFNLVWRANEKFPRKGKVIVKLANKVKADTIYIYQYGVSPSIAFPDKEARVSAVGKELEVNLNTNIPASDSTRIAMTVDYDKGEEWVSQLLFNKEMNKMQVKVAANEPEVGERNATLHITYVDDWGKAHTTDFNIGQMEMGGTKQTETISFAEVRKLVNDATGSQKIEEDVAIEGIVVCDATGANNAANTQLSKTDIDLSTTYRTTYVQSLDGKYGFALVFDTKELNELVPFDKVKIWLKGLTLRKEDNPQRYTLTDMTFKSFISKEEGDATKLVKKERTMSELTDNDVYTFVTLKNCEFPIRKGPFTPFNEGYCPTYNQKRVDRYPLLMHDNQGQSMFLMTNIDCPYRRDGNILPQGSGTISGVIVHEEDTRFENGGDIGHYQMRHLSREDIKIDQSKNNSFSTIIAEWNAFKLSGTKVLPSEGNGELWHTAVTPTASTDYGYLGVIDGVTDGKGIISASKNLAFQAKTWWNSSTGKANSWMIKCSTSGITGTHVSLQLATLNYSVGAPRYWNVEWSEHGNEDGEWTKVGEYTIPDVVQWGNTLYEQLNAWKNTNIELPLDLLGKSTVYLRLIPSANKAGTTTTYDTAVINNNSTSGLMYVSIRYNK